MGINAEDSVKRLPKFSEYTFNLQQIGDLLNISRSSLYRYLEEEGVEGKVKKAGASKKFYDWDDYYRVSKKVREKIKKPEKKIKAYINKKGGVGKTSLTSQTAMKAACLGLKVLVIDVDPQGHTTLALGVDNCPGAFPTLKEFFEKKCKIRDLIIDICPLLSVIPSNTLLDDIELALRSDFGGTHFLKRAIKDLCKDYDVVFIDTNPSMSWLTLNAIISADELCVVTETQLYSIDGLRDVFETLSKLEDRFPDFAPSIRIIPNKYQFRQVSSQESMGHLRDNYGDILTKTIIRENADLKNAQKDMQAVFISHKKSTAAADIADLVNELLDDHTV